MDETNPDSKKKTMRLLLIFNAVLLAVGNCGGPLIMRLYFIHGGKRVWLSCWLETGGWPINFIPLVITYLHRRSREGPRAKLFFMRRPVFLAAAVIGALTGLDVFIYANGVSRLPVSTSSLIIASQLSFTALFAYLLVKQKFTAYSINAVVLLTIGPGVLALHGSSDRPKGESSREYYLGFFMIIGESALYGLILPMVEMTYKRAKQAITYTLVMEIQLVTCFFATVVCTIGMLINNDFKGLRAKLFFMRRPVFLAAAVIGALTGLDVFIYANGVSRLPVSTSSLIIASQLSFTALFAYLLVKQKFTAYSINAVVLLTIGPGVLALHGSSDRPKGESSREYYLGFFMIIGESALYGLILPMVEMTYKRAKQAITYTLVMEIQLVTCFFATVVCTIGMLINNDFKAIPKEARNFGLGETTYYVVLVCSGIIWQCFFLGAIGVTFSASSLHSAVIIAMLLPVTEILAVIFYSEKFRAEKGVSLVLSLWGFVSYFYGEIKQSKKIQNQNPETPMAQINHAP